MRRLLTVLLAAAPVAPLSAQTPGAYAFLRLDTSPRSAALAGAADAIPADDPAVLFANPALLDGSQAGAVGLTYLNHLGDVNAGSLAYARRIGGFDAALGVRYLGYGEMKAANADGEVTGTFSASSVALTAGTSYVVNERLRLGGAVTLATVGIDDARTTAVSADLGAAYRMPGNLTVSASARHLGTALSNLGTTDDELPLDLRVGVSKRLRYLPLQVSVVGYDLQNPGAGQADRSTAEQALGHVAVGGTLFLGRAVEVRLGFSPRRNQELATAERLDLAGLGLGFGLRVRQFALDYGFASWSENGGLHHLGVRARL